MAVTAKVERALNYLLVEDDPNHAKIIELCLRQGGLPHKCYQVGSGADCLKYLAGEEPFEDRDRYPYPNVLLLDIRMPGTLDGLQTLQAVRSDTRHRALVVVVLTASDREVDVTRAYEFGANAYIVKSDKTSELIDQLLQVRWSFDSLVQLP